MLRRKNVPFGADVRQRCMQKLLHLAASLSGSGDGKVCAHIQDALTGQYGAIAEKTLLQSYGPQLGTVTAAALAIQSRNVLGCGLHFLRGTRLLNILCSNGAIHSLRRLRPQLDVVVQPKA